MSRARIRQFVYIQIIIRVIRIVLLVTIIVKCILWAIACCLSGDRDDKEDVGAEWSDSASHRLETPWTINDNSRRYTIIVSVYLCILALVYLCTCTNIYIYDDVLYVFDENLYSYYIRQYSKTHAYIFYGFIRDLLICKPPCCSVLLYVYSGFRAWCEVRVAISSSCLHVVWPISEYTTYIHT